MKGWIESSPNRQTLKDYGNAKMSRMHVDRIFYVLKAVKSKTLLSKPTYKLSELATCENMIWQETLRGLMSGEGEVLFIFAWAGKAQPGL